MNCRDRQRLAAEMGGAERVARQKAAGKLTIRERFDDVLRPRQSFTEVGSTAGVGTYDDDGRLVVVHPRELRVRHRRARRPPRDRVRRRLHGAGRLERVHHPRQAPVRRAHRRRAPPAPHPPGRRHGRRRLGQDDRDQGTDQHPRRWRAGRRWSSTSAVAPSVALALGSVAGIGAARVATSHYSVIVADTAQMMIAGPGPRRPGLAGRRVEGGAGPRAHPHRQRGHRRRGRAPRTRRSSGPAGSCPTCRSNVWELPPRGPITDDPDRRDEQADLDRAPRAAPGVQDARDHRRRVSTSTASSRSGKGWGKSIITGFARLDGWPVARVRRGSLPVRRGVDGRRRPAS